MTSMYGAKRGSGHMKVIPTLPHPLPVALTLALTAYNSTLREHEVRQAGGASDVLL